MRFDLMKVLSAFEKIAIIGGIVFAGWQVSELSKQTAIQSKTLKQTQQVNSADLVFRLRATLDGGRFARLVADIQNHDHTYPLRSRSESGKSGKWSDLDIEQYLSVFESIGYLVDEDLVVSKMAFDEFSYDVEKTWCNADVQRVITEGRKTDKSTGRQTDPIFGELEKLARDYLAREGETCKDLDNQ